MLQVGDKVKNTGKYLEAWRGIVKEVINYENGHTAYWVEWVHIQTGEKREYINLPNAIHKA